VTDKPWQQGDYPGPERVRGHIKPVVRDLVEDEAVAEQLVDRLTLVGGDIVIEAVVHMMGLHLRTLPPGEAKAKMFDALVAMGALEDLAKMTTRKRGS